MELSQVRLAVRDFARMFRFYRDVVGLSPQVDDDHGPYAKFSFPSGTAALALQSRDHLEKVLGTLSDSDSDRLVIAVRVDRLDDVVATLRSRGATFMHDPHDLWGRMRVAHLRDPEGHVLEFQEWLQG